MDMIANAQRPVPALVRPAASGSAEWAARSAAFQAEQPGRDASRRTILEYELAHASAPQDVAALQRELARLGVPVASAPRATPAPAPAARAPKPAAASAWDQLGAEEL